jgi:uncharacterized cysteine cluster protein YcgN (CxxCxxCC family)
MWKNRTAASLTDDNMPALLCPECGECYLHQGNTTIFQRNEDEGFTRVIAQDGDTATVTNFPSGDTHNPSRRRHGLIIEFLCEHCNYSYDSASDEVSPERTEPFRLAIYQHKGCTYVEWVS